MLEEILVTWKLSSAEDHVKKTKEFCICEQFTDSLFHSTFPLSYNIAKWSETLLINAFSLLFLFYFSLGLLK